MLLSSTGLLMLLHSWFLPGTRAFSTSSSSLSDTRASCAPQSRNRARQGARLGRELPGDSVRTASVSFTRCILGTLRYRLSACSVGNLQLRLPRAIDSYHGTVDAASFGNQCIQQGGSLPSNLPSDVLEATVPYFGRFAADPSVPQSEDCLNLNIIRPANIPADAQLPILFWIYGGFFAVRSNTTPLHNGTAIVQRSIHLGQPVIYVAVNYRVNVFGFLGGAEVEKAGIGNLGLQDQRTALHWVQKHISSFGGDPNKVMIWGESAGLMSVFFHQRLDTLTDTISSWHSGQTT
ncbi:alpha/beta-hydrolase [Lentinus brumalis]|uniref:Carboxylic ester hydrolase n=1 Tax=Lentinus brumalis TaxID=2498619 RepID=A0A371CRE6_9APHY|nr:alpha/beta-hydrolase [Polyporus brumalis]